MTFDNSLVQVAIPFTYTDLVQPISIGSATIGYGIPALAAGWGFFNVSG